MLSALLDFNRPTQVELFDIEQRAHDGATTPADVFALIHELERTRQEAAEAEGDAEAAREAAEDLERDRSKLEDEVYALKRERDGTAGPDKSDLMEAVEIWRKRAEEAEAKLSRRAQKKAGR